MIARITLFAVAVSGWGLLTTVASAQESSRYAASQTGFVNCDAGHVDADVGTCTDPGCEQIGCETGADVSCDGIGRWNQWLGLGRLGRKHHPHCRCPLCCPRPTWASFEALMWWGEGRSVPPLVTGGPDGVLPDAGVLFGDGDVGTGMAPGARTNFGVWFDQCETLGMGAKFWGLDGDGTSFSADSDDQPLMFRPFHELTNFTDMENAFSVSRADRTGRLSITTTSSVLGCEAYLRTSMLAGRGYDVDLLGGYSFMRLDDDINIFSVSDIISGPFTGSRVELLDLFDARNEFHGGEVGLTSEVRYDCWTLTGLAKFSVGNMHQVVTIDGYDRRTTVGGSVTTQGAILALPTNIGTYARDRTVWIPEVGISAAYKVRDWLRLTVGYSGVWISDVVFSGDQIDQVVNPTQFTGGLLDGPARPAFTFRSTDYWLHGLNLGATLTY